MPKTEAREPAITKAGPKKRSAQMKKIKPKSEHPKPGKVDAETNSGSSSNEKKVLRTATGLVSRAAVTPEDKIAYAINKLYSGTRFEADMGPRKTRTRRDVEYTGFMNEIFNHKTRKAKGNAIFMKKLGKENLRKTGELRKMEREARKRALDDGIAERDSTDCLRNAAGSSTASSALVPSKSQSNAVSRSSDIDCN